MRTLPREPWRGGQICGYQTAYGLPWSIFCGEFKKPGSPVCEEHDRELREENYGVLPKFADGNALGLRLWQMRRGQRKGWWAVGRTSWIAAAPSRKHMEEKYGFTLRWEPFDGDVPITPTPEELAAFQAQLKE